MNSRGIFGRLDCLFSRALYHFFLLSTLLQNDLSTHWLNYVKAKTLL